MIPRGFIHAPFFNSEVELGVSDGNSSDLGYSKSKIGKRS
jgi:hypothetical protein